MGWPSTLLARRAQKKLVSALGRFEVPAFPTAVQEMMVRLRDPESTSTGLAQTVAKDPALTVRILKLVNSTAFGARKPIVNLAQAVTMVGRSQLESIVVSIGVSRTLKASSPTGSLQKFWEHASRRATLARHLALQLDQRVDTLSYTAGLLSDVAVPLLSSHLAEHRVLVDRCLHEEPGSLHRREQERFGWNHAEVAKWVCQAWGLPQTLTHAIANHHDDVDKTPSNAKLSDPEGPNLAPLHLATTHGDGAFTEAKSIAGGLAEAMDACPKQTHALVEQAFQDAGALVANLQEA